jgi:transposase
MRTNHRYSDQFKDEAARLAFNPDYGSRRAARELGVPEASVRAWMKDRKLSTPKRQAAVEESMARALKSKDIDIVKARLREADRQIRKLTVEKEILKKATAFFAREQP